MNPYVLQRYIDYSMLTKIRKHYRMSIVCQQTAIYALTKHHLLNITRAECECMLFYTLLGSMSIRLKQFEQKKKHPGGEIILGLLDPSRNRLASTAYFIKPGCSVLVELSFSRIDRIYTQSNLYIAHHVCLVDQYILYTKLFP